MRLSRDKVDSRRASDILGVNLTSVRLLKERGILTDVSGNGSKAHRAVFERAEVEQVKQNLKVVDFKRILTQEVQERLLNLSQHERREETDKQQPRTFPVTDKLTRMEAELKEIKDKLDTLIKMWS